ncbi:unnamed protein product [Didymodactylos carnosus]|uniref:Uncharacterized protein n=1 Tax=Didymodactylos carnosus TaxID=1234261 RepID=A0A815E6Y6_9BILA|nr:unnamed protein product [Didymodactylos carnosus]CAF4147741.1 unnamed protein product [Didymodactylos carnosus]
MDIVNYLQGITHRFKKKLLSLNTFKSIPQSNDKYVIENQIISTRVYIVIVLAGLIITALYASLVTTATVTMVSPDLSLFYTLLEKYFGTVSCPCSQITVQYDTFISLNVQFHQICSSYFISKDWIHSFTDRINLILLYNDDFRVTAPHQFQALADLCQLFNTTIADELSSFLSTDLISSKVMHSDVFLADVEANLYLFQLTTTKTVRRLYDLIRSTTQGNQLLSALSTSWVLKIDDTSLGLMIRNYLVVSSNSNCSCYSDSRCVEPSALYDYTASSVETIEFVVPGFYSGCFIVESLLPSTMKCFYNRSCIDQIHYVDPYISTSVPILDSSLPTIYPPDTTLETMLNELFIENWNSTISFELYYNNCHPYYCTYTSVQNHGILYIITTIVGVFGGLTTVSKMSIPIAVAFIRKRKIITDSTVTSSAIGFIVRSKLVFEQLKHYVMTMNMFKTVRHATNQHYIKNGIIATRIYFVSIIVSLFILTLYTSLTTILTTFTVKSPSLNQSRYLHNKYPDTLSCPCSEISIPYRTLFTIQPEYHAICSSDFISADWINYVIGINSSYSYYADFRFTSPKQFQVLSDFCQLSDRTISDALNVFYSTKFISAKLLDSELFAYQTKAILALFEDNTINTFRRSFRQIRSTIQGNQLMSGLLSNAAFYLVLFNNKLFVGSYHAEYIDADGSLCNCGNRACVSPSAFYMDDLSVTNTDPLFIVPHFYTGCLVIDSLMMSTLECFYNQYCLNQIKIYINSTSAQNFTILTSSASSGYQQNSTIETIVNHLFIENWHSNVSYQMYYNFCTPSYCTYSYSDRRDIASIITIMIGVYGGLTAVLKIILPTLVSFIKKELNKSNNQITTVTVASVSSQ